MELLTPHINGKVIPFKIMKRDRWSKEPFAPHETIMGIVGSSGSGKSTFLLHALPNIAPKFVKHIIICSRIEGNEIYDAIKSWCDSTKKTYDFASTPPDAMDIIEKRINEKKNEDDHIIVVFDDFNQSSKSEKTDPYNKISIDVITKGRNYKIHSIFIIQQYQSLNTTVRTNLNTLVVFNMNDRYAKIALSKDFCSMTGIDEDTFYNLLNKIKIKHSYLFATNEGIHLYVHGQTNGLRKLQFE
jgi:ABC-type dipeptide/oligopeptide/nickel transport system ATPase component